MKPLFLCRKFSLWLLAGTLITLVDGNALAAGAGAGGAGGATGAGVSAGAVGGGGHGGGGGGALGGGHAAVSAGGTGAMHSASGFSGGGRSVGFSNSGQHVSAGFSSGHYGGLVPTGFPSPQGTGVSPANGTGYARTVNPGYGTLGRGNVVGGRTVANGFGSNLNRGFGGNPSFGNRPVASALNTPRVHNAWTEGNNPHVNPAVRASRYGYNANAYDQDRSVLRNQLGTAQRLYPNASNYNALAATHNHAWQGPAGRGYDAGSRRGGHGDYNRQTRDAYNRFFFTSAFFPYLYGSFFPAYYGYYDNGYLGTGFGGYLGTDDGSLNANYGTPTFNDATGPYVPTDGSQYDNRSTNPAPQNTPPTDDQNLPPDQPSSVGPQNPSASEERESTETGPDTLVESVQNELAKRGYYGGKVDSMYNPATQTALRRFQSDQHLAVTGRINEATLHALQLD